MTLLLTLLASVQVAAWSAAFDLSAWHSVENTVLALVVTALTLKLHRKWALESVLSATQWLLLLNVFLLLMSFAHGRWLSEDTTPWGTGISDAHYVLGALRAAQDGTGAWLTPYLAGPLLWMAGLTAVFGTENYYAVALANTLFQFVGALALLTMFRQTTDGRPSAVAWLFLLHPYTIVLAATIYKDPMVLCGTVLVFAGIALQLEQRTGTALTTTTRPSPAMLLAAGLALTLVFRMAFAAALVGFILLVVVVVAAREGRFGQRIVRNTALALGVLAVVLFVAQRAGLLTGVLSSATRVYDSEYRVSTAPTGGYVADADSLGMRYLSGPLVQRLPTVPLQIAMQLASPFPPTLRPITNIYLWVEETFGAINISLAPFIALGIVAAWRSRQGPRRLVLVYCLFIVTPAIAFGGVIGRQLYPIVPFLIVLAWLGWRHLANGMSRIIVALTVPAFWIVAFAAYGWLRGA